MIKAVLFQLEDTLLHGVDGAFAETVQHSIAAISRSNPGIAELASAYEAAIKQLSHRRDMMTSNADIAAGCVAAALGSTREELHEDLDAFFALLNGALKERVAAHAGAVPLVKQLLDQNLSVALAVEPVYPETTVLQWLDWAGLGAEVEALGFLGHSQNLHFIDPDPALYAEIAARTGVEPDETIVVGHCHSKALASASAAGLHIWQVCETSPMPTFLEMIRSTSRREQFGTRPIAVETIEPQLRGNIGALYGLLAEAKPHQWRQKPDPDEWSILQILCHLADAEAPVHHHRLQRILTEERPFLSSPPPPGPDLPPCHDDGYEVLNRFRDERLKTMRLLTGLKAEDWQRPARHSIFGLTTLREMAYFTAQHDRLHITQLCQTLGKCSDTL